MADSVHSSPVPAAAGPSKSVKPNLLTSAAAAALSSAYHSPLLCKLFLFLLLLLAIPLLPSQAPDLFNQSFLTNLWELSQLLFIGLAVSYGLFSRRNVESDDHIAADGGSQFNVDESQSSFVSRIFQVSPLFEDSYEVPSSECEDKMAVSHTGPGVRISAGGYGCLAADAAAYDGYGNNQCLSVEDGFEVGDEVIQAWNAQYFQGQSTVVVSQPNLDLLGQTELEKGQNNTLGLPVRSLNSRARDFNLADFGGISKPAAAAQSKGNDDESYGSGEELFGGVAPVNLEDEFNRTADYSDFSWHSKSFSMGRKEMGGVASADRPGHFRPHSVDETQFESFKSESFFGSSKAPVSYKDGVMQNSVTTHLHTRSESVPSELPNPDMDESGGDDKTFHLSYPSVTLSPPPARLNGGSRMNAFHLRKYSGSGSLFKKETQGSSRGVLKEKDLGSSRNPLKGLEDNKSGVLKEKDLGSSRNPLKGLEDNKSDDEPEKKKKSQMSLNVEKKAENELLAKPSPRGKSVRTVRLPGGSSTTAGVKKATAAAMGDGYPDVVAGKVSVEIGAVDTAMKNNVANLPKPSFAEHKKSESKRSSARVSLDDGVGKTYDETEAVDTSKKNHAAHPAKPTYAEYKKRDSSRKSSARVSVEPAEYQERKNETRPLSLNDEPVMDTRGGEVGRDQDFDEVDRKAAEFIAKFREQIMLQKVASIERSSRKRALLKDSR